MKGRGKLMKLKLILVAAAMLVGTVAYADTLNNAAGFNQSTGVFSAFNQGTRGSCNGMGVCTDGTPFWNNTSGDVVSSSGNPGGSNLANAGDFLSAGGAFGTGTVLGCSTCGTNYMASNGQMYTQAANSPNFATAFSFIRQAASVTITLLYANSSTNNNAEFGIYDASSQNNALMNHEVVQAVGTNLNNIIGQTYSVTQNYATWGVYARTCSQNAPTGACPGGPSGFVQTEFSNLAMNSVNGDTPAADANHMHWALFQSGTNAAVYYLALKDYVFTGTQTRNPTEGYGDYNDIILRIDTSIASIPEPATLSIMGLGLVGLGILGRRKLKK
jgi:hypothetical protein